ncbi:MAG TPA: hypothetical protein VIX81_07675 [Gammaproteobacteria bacterium]
MPDLAARLADTVGGFPIHGRMLMRYSLFAPRLYNLCKRLGFRPGRMLPSRAFCSDESQGYPVILLAKHFGAFPFNHGRVGGVVSTDRHRPHADHGEDLVLLQASHVGFDPETGLFGDYRRLQTEACVVTPTCGKLDAILGWYLEEHRFARDNVGLQRDGERVWVTIDNQLLREERPEGLVLRLDRLLAGGAEGLTPNRILSTAKTFAAAPGFAAGLDLERVPGDRPRPIGDDLTPELFSYHHVIGEDDEGRRHLERNLIRFMPHIVTAPAPLLMAAQLNTQVEFDRTFRSIVREHAYSNKRLLFVSGLHIDISPQPGQLFPLTKFVPWAAYLQQPDGGHRIIEQEELVELLRAESTENPDQVDLEAAIAQMAAAREVQIPF